MTSDIVIRTLALCVVLAGAAVGVTHVSNVYRVSPGIGLPNGAVPLLPGHLGMTGMNERAIAIGATLRVVPRSAGGTRVELIWRHKP